MDAYNNIPRNPYGFLGSRPATNPVINSDGRTGPVSSYFTDGNGGVETTVQRVPPSDMPVGSYEVARDRPQIVDEFLKKIQTEVSQPAWPLAMYQSPYGLPRAAPMVQFGLTTRVDFGDSTNEMPRSVTESRFDVQSRVTPPTIYRKTLGPPRTDAKIGQATNDIAEATEYLKVLARPSIPNNNTITVPQNMVPSRPAAVNNATAPVTIDSREAARRYPKAIVSMEPYNKESFTPMLDSKTVKDKYKGASVSWSDPI